MRPSGINVSHYLHTSYTAYMLWLWKQNPRFPGYIYIYMHNNLQNMMVRSHQTHNRKHNMKTMKMIYTSDLKKIIAWVTNLSSSSPKLEWGSLRWKSCLREDSLFIRSVPHSYIAVCYVCSNRSHTETILTSRCMDVRSFLFVSHSNDCSKVYQYN